MTLCSTQNTEANFKRKVQIAFWFMKCHKANGGHIVHRMPKIKQQFSDIDHSHQLKISISYDHAVKHFLLRGQFNKLT